MLYTIWGAIAATIASPRYLYFRRSSWDAMDLAVIVRVDKDNPNKQELRRNGKPYIPTKKDLKAEDWVIISLVDIKK